MKKVKCGKFFERSFLYFMYAFLILYAISMLVPIFWMLSTAVKGPIEYNHNKLLFPMEGFHFENFSWAFNNLRKEVVTSLGLKVYDVFSMFGISLLYSLINPLWNLLWTTLIAFVMSKFKFKGNNFLYALGLFVMITPLYGSSVSTMQLKKALGIYDNIILHIFVSPSIAFCGMHFMMLYGAFKSTSWTYAEAAYIDGAGNWRVFLTIYLPMVLPLCTVIYVLSFLSAWNDYGTFLVWLPSYPNLAYGIYNFQVDSKLYGANINQIVAGFCLVAIPSSILYISTQKLISANFTVGGLKG